MAFNNTAPLSYASGEVVLYVDAQRGVAESAGGPHVTINGVYSPRNNDVYEPDQTSNTSSITSAAANTTSAVLIAGNVNRKGVVIVNEANATLYIAFANTANNSAYTYPVYANGVFEMVHKWTGPISGILSTGTGAIRITEIS